MLSIRRRVVFIRGLPGSGKSWLASTHFSDMHLVEADQYFMSNGVYSYSKERIADAHVWALKQMRSKRRVVVANTFTRKWELDFYYTYASNPLVITCVGSHSNIHGVPSDVIEKMRQRWEPIEGEVILSNITTNSVVVEYKGCSIEFSKIKNRWAGHKSLLECIDALIKKLS
jgi:hypothetical protein